MNLSEKSFELREIHRLEGHTDRVWNVAWKPATGVDGIPAVLASCSGDKTVCIWEQSPSTGSFHCKAVLEEIHTRTVRFCAWSPSGKMIATASFDATTVVWDHVGDEYECVSTLEAVLNYTDLTITCNWYHHYTNAITDQKLCMECWGHY